MTTPATYTPEQLGDLLVEGGRLTGTHPMRAAMHLLTFTELIHHRDFARFLEITEVRDHDGSDVLAAFVSDWDELLNSRNAQMAGGGAYRMLTLAASLATGKAVDVRECMSSLGHASARRVIEAIAIAFGAAEDYTIEPTAALQERLARRDELLGE